MGSPTEPRETFFSFGNLKKNLQENPAQKDSEVVGVFYWVWVGEALGGAPLLGPGRGVGFRTGVWGSDQALPPSHPSPSQLMQEVPPLGFNFKQTSGI